MSLRKAAALRLFVLVVNAVRNIGKRPGLTLQKIGTDVYHDAADNGQLVVQNHLLRKVFFVFSFPGTASL